MPTFINKEKTEKLYKLYKMKTAYRSQAKDKKNDARDLLGMERVIYQERSPEDKFKYYDPKLKDKLAAKDYSALDGKICGISSGYHNAVVWLEQFWFDIRTGYTPKVIADFINSSEYQPYPELNADLNLMGSGIPE